MDRITQKTLKEKNEQRNHKESITNVIWSYCNERWSKKKIQHIERTIAEIVQEPEGGDDYFGLVSDYMWEDFGAKQLIKELDIKVLK